MADRAHLSIGEVLSLLQDDFPDVTISKIRFLESQGLLDPERTPSGYRKFYEGDIERLRWILRHQRDHFLPLKVIKDRLEESAAAGLVVPPDEPTPAAGTATTPPGAEGPTADGASAIAPAEAPEPAAAAPDGRRPPVRTPSLFATKAPAEPAAEPAAMAAVVAPPAPVEPPVQQPAPQPPRPRAAPVMPELPPRPAANPLDGGPSSVSLSLDELVEATGLTHRELGELGRFGLLNGYQVGGDTFYDGDALVVARTAAGFMRFGIEARHLRMYKVAAEREAGFMEQVVMPLLKQRNPTARAQAATNLGELAQLGEQLRSALLRGALRTHTDPR
jgi:DNA-binding transcriptional MerR regulator